MKNKKRFRIAVHSLLGATALLSIACLSSCNTTKGLGEDLQKLGREIEEEADEHL